MEKKRNLWVLPTDKPSRLIKNSNENTFKLCIQTLPLDRELGCLPQNIYITSDEEIKEGDYFLYDGTEIRYKSNGTEYHGRDLCHISGNRRYPISKSKKIILTNDQELIKNGVQPIDDEFLEWFVKNPNCESVQTEPIPNSNWGFDIGEPVILGYKPIIPQDEAKQRAKNYMSLKGALEPNQIKCYCGHTSYCDCSPLEEPKQETLEEAADTYAKKQYGNSCGAREERKICKEDFIAGAKWMEQRMYSEKEVIGLCMSAYNQATKDGSEAWLGTFDKWFEQFSKLKNG